MLAERTASRELERKVAVVTGAARGIGRAIAETLAATAARRSRRETAATGKGALGSGGGLCRRRDAGPCAQLRRLPRRGGRERPDRWRRPATTVMPFILRAVALLGIDSVQLPIGSRRELWARLGDSLRPRHLAAITTDLDIGDVKDVVGVLRSGGSARRRRVLDIGSHRNARAHLRGVWGL